MKSTVSFCRGGTPAIRFPVSALGIAGGSIPWGGILPVSRITSRLWGSAPAPLFTKSIWTRHPAGTVTVMRPLA